VTAPGGSRGSSPTVDESRRCLIGGGSALCLSVSASVCCCIWIRRIYRGSITSNRSRCARVHRPRCLRHQFGLCRRSGVAAGRHRRCGRPVLRRVSTRVRRATVVVSEVALFRVSSGRVDAAELRRSSARRSWIRSEPHAHVLIPDTRQQDGEDVPRSCDVARAILRAAGAERHGRTPLLQDGTNSWWGTQ
jgi:hypothetical protein